MGEDKITIASTAGDELLLLLGTEELVDGEVKKMEVPGLAALAVYKIDGAFFATDDTCTHGAASLADGFIEDGQIECPFHAGRFDIRTGQPTSHPCMIALRVYKLVVEGRQVFVQVPGRAVKSEREG